ncbi:MAG: recombination mediator RecR [Alphaproteobacteria bacterium]|nr:recombination mediator RecR [Alphaproteobacteria bacterium]
MPDSAIDHLVRLLGRLPGLGPRSARRVALDLLRHREQLLTPLMQALEDASEKVRECGTCGNLDLQDPCGICTDPKRDRSLLCVVEDVADLWALERAQVFRGRYHVLGGVLSALDGVGPEDLRIAALVDRAGNGELSEVILAMNATVDGQTTAHYISDRLKEGHVAVSRLAHGVPVGGELDYLDDGTLQTALKARRPL